LPYDLALYDLISPYVLRGDTFGQWHAARSVIYVTVAVDDGGIVIRGIGKYSGDIGRPNFDPKTMTLSWAAENTEGHPAKDPGRRDPWIDISDDQIVFELSAPRVELRIYIAPEGAQDLAFDASATNLLIGIGARVSPAISSSRSSTRAPAPSA
jgi:hypothetical protein